MKLTIQRSMAVVLWLAVCVACMWMRIEARAQAFTTTTVQGTVYLANGQPGSGVIQLSWPAFTTANNQAVAAGRTNVTIGADGYMSVRLAPNQGAAPAGLYYTAVYHLGDGTTSTEYWLVPAAAQASLSQVRAQVMPAAQAVQAVSKGYVDQSITQLTQSLLTASGGSLSGPLFLNGDPLQPTQAATKRYVDNEFANALPASGGVASGPLTSVQLGAAYQVDQFTGADFGAKLQACLNRLDAVYGGTCDARNFTGSQSIGSTVLIATANATVQLPCATIATSNQIRITAATRNVTFHGCALRGASTASGSQGGTVLLYSGTGPMIQVGDPTYVVDTVGFHIDNVVMNTTASSNSAAQGMAAYRTQEMNLEGLYLLGNSNQIGMTLDGTGNYTGGTFQDLQFTGFGTALNAIGHQVSNAAPTDWVNASTFVRLHINCPTNAGSPVGGTYGINLVQGDGNTFTGGDVEGCGTALHLGPNAQNNTIVGLRNENSIKQVVADPGSSYNNWMTGGTMFAGQLSDNGTRNSFLDTFHRSFNGLNGDWYGSQADATITNHYRVGTGAGNERGLLNRYQSDYGYRWTTGLSDASAGEQFYQVLDELNNVNRISVGQYNHGQASTNNQTVINAAGTGAVVLNGSANAGTGGVVIGSGGATASTVATINSSGNAQFNGTLQVGGASTFTNSTTVKNQADSEIDSVLWAGSTANQKESYVYKDYSGASQWYMVKDANNNWALNSAVGGLDSFKAYQSNNSGDTYVNASNAGGHIRLNYEPGSGSETDIYSGPSSTLVAAFLGSNSIKFPGLAAPSGRNCMQIDNSGYLSNTGSPCATGGGTNGTVNAGNAGQVAYYSSNGTAIAGTTSVPVTAGGTGATTIAQALVNLGAQEALSGVSSDGASGLVVNGNIAASDTSSGTVNGVYDLKAKFGPPGFGSSATMTCTGTAGSNVLTGCSGGDFAVGSTVFIPAAGVLPTIATPTGVTAVCGQTNSSCTGSTVYGYKIVAVQGSPNGAMTAASTAVTVTQATQMKQQPFNTLLPDVYTTVSWPNITNASLWLIYKSINGGPYNFYTYTWGQLSIKDYGSMSSSFFTCDDMSVPCTAPLSAIPNDVYAQITAVSGSSVTLGPWSSTYGGQPIYNAVAGLPCGSAYPSTPSVSGSFTVQHDDTPPFVAASIFFRAGNQGQLHIPRGQYHVHTANPNGGHVAAFLTAGWKNVTVLGDGDPTYIYQSNDRFGTAAAFISSMCGDVSGICTAWRMGGNVNVGALAAYNLNDPVSVGSTTIQFATPSDASHFPAGQTVTIFDDSGLSMIYPANMYGEVNQIATVDTTTGVATLVYPTMKMYASTLSPPWNLCTACAAQPKIAVLPRVEADHITFKDFSFKGHAQFFMHTVTTNATIENVKATVAVWANSQANRHLVYRNNTIYDGGYSGSYPYGLVSGSGGDTDFVFEDNQYTESNVGTGQTCTEGSAHFVIRNNTITIQGIQDYAGGGNASYTNRPAAIPVIGMCFGITMTGNTVNVQNANVSGVISNTGMIAGTVTGNHFFVDAVYDRLQDGSSGSLIAAQNNGNQNPYFRIFDNDWNVGKPGAGATTVAGNSHTIGTLTTLTLANQSGVVSFYTNYGTATVTNIQLAGSIASILFGNAQQRLPGLYFALNFIQPSAGGTYNYTIPSSCSDTGWNTGGNGIDCPAGSPSIRTGAGAQTMLWFYDDGVTIHYVSSSSNAATITGVTAGAGMSGGGTSGSVTLNCATATVGTNGCSQPDGTTITINSNGVLSSPNAAFTPLTLDFTPSAAASGISCTGTNPYTCTAFPTGARICKLLIVSGGAGGGSGATCTNASTCFGGGGGSGGASQNITVPCSFFGSGSTAAVTVTVGTGGAGGSAQAGASASGNAGTNGTVSSVCGAAGSFPCVSANALYQNGAYGSNPGAGGTATTGTGGAGGGITNTPMCAGENGASGTPALWMGCFGTSVYGGPEGGAGGGGLVSGTAVAGAGIYVYPPMAFGKVTFSSGTSGGTAGGGNGSTPVLANGWSFFTYPLFAVGGTGGGSNCAGNGGTGGTGTDAGGGGGGGGAACNGNSSGAGGRGGPGMVRIIVE